MSESEFVPFHRPSIGQEELDAVRGVLASGWLTTGPVAMKFERAFAEYIGCKYALAVNSATAALQLALDAIGVGPGDEVLVPTYTFTASAAVVTHFGAKPVLCDSEQDGFNIDPEEIRKRVTGKTRAIMPVHIAGQPCDMESIWALGKEFGLHVIEDCAHALPAHYQGVRVGAASEMAAFSFYATKTITTGEGGMFTTNNQDFLERASMMRLHGIGRDAWKRYSKEGSWAYQVVEAGFKLNLPDILAAIGAAQLQKSDQFWKRRQAIAQRYLTAFSDIEEVDLPPGIEPATDHAWHLFILRFRSQTLSIGRDQIIEELKKLGIGTSVHFIPLHLHEFYARTYGYRAQDFPNARESYSRSISLPIYPDMREDEVDRVISAVRKIVAENRQSMERTTRVAS